MDKEKYTSYAQAKEEEFESVCTRCGQCCGSGDDPCSNLIQKEDGSYFCKSYPTRLGRQKTVEGYEFNCVPIGEHIRKGTLRSGCAYLNRKY